MSPENVVGALDHRRAAFAYSVVATIRQEADKQQKLAEDYATQAQNLPIMILQNGLGQAVAFLMSKAKGDRTSPEGRLLEHLAKWLFDEADEEKTSERRRSFLTPRPGATGTERLMLSLLAADRHEWSRAQHEAVALGTWLKRFSEALMPRLEAHQKDAAS